jgi:hypothetical protein
MAGLNIHISLIIRKKLWGTEICTEGRYNNNTEIKQVSFLTNNSSIFSHVVHPLNGQQPWIIITQGDRDGT